MGGGGVRVAESLKFSSGDQQQETTHLHFQRPALSASPPPGRPGSKALPWGTVAAGGVGGIPRGRPQSAFPGPSPPFPKHTSNPQSWVGGCAPGVQVKGLSYREGL